MKHRSSKTAKFNLQMENNQPAVFNMDKPFMTRFSHYKPWGGALTTLLCNFLIESQF
jgi:hypothetical protein